jgi:N-acetylneuraminic acid mutarotase
MSNASIRSLKIVALCAALGAMTATAHAQAQGSWAMKAPLPAPLNEVAVAAVDGKIHVMGGSVLGITGPYHQEYDPATDKWAARAPLPRSLDHMGATVMNGKIYLVGGFIGGGVHRDGQNAVSEYDPKSNTWRILAPLKAGRGSVGVAVFEGKLHAIGGRDPAGNTVTTHEVYDPATNTWKDLAPLPRARDHAAATAAEGKIYFAGGRYGASTDPSDMLDIYDPKTNTWTSGPPMPTKRSGLAGTFYKGLFMVLGGEVPAENRTNVENEAYDVKANAWRKLAPMPAGRHATGAAMLGDNVYLSGGSLGPGGSRITDQTIVFTLP